jgi:DNA (cytosine-5)-methyltransferase 1
VKHKVLDLFSGIGGFSLGLERTGGFETVAFCELDKAAGRVLNKHWPNVPVYEDIKKVEANELRANGIVPDVICGGFPCQDISKCGSGVNKGIHGERSGLWSEMFRLIRDVQPRYVIAENVSALRTRGLTLVVQNLCSIGYCVEWHCIPASAVGAPHRRDRIWIIATSNSYSQSKSVVSEHDEASRLPSPLANSNSAHGQGGGVSCRVHEEVTDADCRSLRGETTEVVANPSSKRREGSRELKQPVRAKAIVNREAVKSFYGRIKQTWGSEPDVGRVAHGVPRRVDRLRQLGNAVVPQIPQFIGECILDYERGVDV